jgi:hypothetical protein
MAMTGKRLVRVAALLAVLLPAGCQSWCARNYPAMCAQPCCYPAQCCQPCSPVPVAATVQAAPPPPAPAWNQPRTGCTCTCP